MLQILLYDDMANVCSQHKEVLGALEVLLKYGARSNISVGDRGTAYSLSKMVICLSKLIAHLKTISL